MGKGSGCVPTKSKHAPMDEGDFNAASNLEITTDNHDIHQTSEDPTPGSTDTTQLKIFIVFYSMYGHVEELAKKMKKGVDGVGGVEAVLFRVPETLSGEVLEHMNAPSKDSQIPVIKVAELPDADGYLFGFPTRYGCMAAQMKSFFDSTGKLWNEQKLAGKPAGFFVGTGTQGGGQETTAWSAITQLAHHGMLFVPIGYTFGAGMFKIDNIRGGSPYGAGVFSSDGSRSPSEMELALAEHQGKYMATIVKRFA